MISTLSSYAQIIIILKLSLVMSIIVFTHLLGISLTISLSFTSCTWHECSADNHASIYVDTRPLEPEVHNFQFLSCPATTHTMEVQSMPARQVLCIFIFHNFTIAKQSLEADLMIIEMLSIWPAYLRYPLLHIQIYSYVLLRTTAKAWFLV